MATALIIGGGFILAGVMLIILSARGNLTDAWKAITE